MFELRALYEAEWTPVNWSACYSGLIRLNQIHLLADTDISCIPNFFSNIFFWTFINQRSSHRVRKSHDKDCWTNAPESGFILKEGSAKRGKSQRECSLLSQCSESVLCSSGGWSVTRCCLWERWEAELMLSLMEKCLTCGRACVAYVAAAWWAAAGTLQPVMRTGRFSSLVSRATLMKLRDARHKT